ncbi:hypothetical protein [Mycobacterium sp. ST-F2]|uniref:hypothetical protein n=1 Tax=Mycobacterium sp. ST-F2 TaxID=1490484 RepID=UPI00114DC744|nr:hypothetical protein [Mycobacterium sp. ST-F2]
MPVRPPRINPRQLYRVEAVLGKRLVVRHGTPYFQIASVPEGGDCPVQTHTFRAWGVRSY